jgi:hypothetical protein
VECVYSGLKSGALQPQNLTLQLNHSNTATLTWAPPVGGCQ